MKKKTVDTLKKKKSKRLIIIFLTLGGIALVIMTAPIWLLQLAVFLMSFDKGPDVMRLRSFQSDIVAQSSNDGQRALVEEKEGVLLSLPLLKKAGVRANSFQDACYSESFGGFSSNSGYSKNCYLADVSFFALQKSTSDALREIKKGLSANQLNLSSLLKSSVNCYVGHIESKDYSDKYPEVRLLISTLGDNACLKEKGFASVFERSKIGFIRNERKYDDQNFIRDAKAKGQRVYVKVIFEKQYFREVMQGRNE